MKYAFQIVDVFSSTPFGGNQLAVLPDAAGISTEGMQKIAREFNFGETTFVCRRTMLRTRAGCASLHPGRNSALRGIPRLEPPVRWR
jgi:trans-2,3-dihydro-3-hydroxyanthranilate isomerase